MTALSPSFIADNPWWKNRSQIDIDPDLQRLANASVRFEHTIPFQLDADAVYTLRGPRQVGKSTLLKRIIRSLLTEQGPAPRQILYTHVEGAGIGTVARLRSALTGYLAWARSAVGADARLYMFLDEITGVKDWGTVVRTLYREGLLANVTVIATGSHALDLARGGETAPGRRGERIVTHPDWIMMPLGFRDYVTAHNEQLGAALHSIDVTAPAHAYEAAQDLQLHGDALRALFDRFLLTGGYPHAMSEEHTAGRIAPGVYGIYRESIIGQMRRAGHSAGPFREVVSWAADHRLGQEFSWNDISGATDIGSKDTARRYVEDAERLFLWHVLYRAQSATDTARALRSPKKLYPADPFAWHVLASWAAGESDPWAGAMTRLGNATLRGSFIEAVAADHFLRGFGPFALYHRRDKGQGAREEIDLLLRRGTVQARLEITYRATIKTGDRKALAKYGGGILASVDQLEWYPKDQVAAIPLCFLLAGYADQITLYPAHLP